MFISVIAELFLIVGSVGFEFRYILRGRIYHSSFIAKSWTFYFQKLNGKNQFPIYAALKMQ